MYKPEKDRKTHYLKARVTESVNKKFAKIAKKRNTTVSKMIQTFVESTIESD